MEDERPLTEQYRADFDYSNFEHEYEGSTADISAVFGQVGQANATMGTMLELMRETDAVALSQSALGNDGYQWCAELRYRVDTRRVSVSFPFLKGNNLHRPVEIRTEVPIKEEEMGKLVHKIAKALQQFVPK